MVLQRDAPLEDLADSIAGTADKRIKRDTISFFRGICWAKGIFASSVGRELEVTEISLNQKTDEPKKLEGRLVCEMNVAEDMLNYSGSMHGGCSAYLVDVCTSAAIALHDSAEGNIRKSRVSQAINTSYHSPATRGDRIRIISTTVSMGKRIMTARCEIWNITHHRIVASAIHSKMAPSPPPASKL